MGDVFVFVLYFKKNKSQNNINRRFPFSLLVQEKYITDAQGKKQKNKKPSTKITQGSGVRGEGSLVSHAGVRGCWLGFRGRGQGLGLSGQW